MDAWPVRLGVHLAEGTGKPSTLHAGEPVLCKHLTCVQSPLTLPSFPGSFFLLLSLSPNSSPEPLTSLWHFASVHLPGPSIPLFFPSVPDLCAPSPKAVTLRDSV